MSSVGFVATRLMSMLQASALRQQSAIACKLLDWLQLTLLLYVCTICLALALTARSACMAGACNPKSFLYLGSMTAAGTGVWCYANSWPGLHRVQLLIVIEDRDSLG